MGFLLFESGTFEWYMFIIAPGARIVKHLVCQVIGVVPKLLYPYLYALPIALLYKQVYNVSTVKETDSPEGGKEDHHEVQQVRDYEKRLEHPPHRPR